MSREEKPEITYRPIGVVRCANKDREATPVQPTYAGGLPGQVEVLDDYGEGLWGTGAEGCACRVGEPTSTGATSVSLAGLLASWLRMIGLL